MHLSFPFLSTCLELLTVVHLFGNRVGSLAYKLEGNKYKDDAGDNI